MSGSQRATCRFLRHSMLPRRARAQKMLRHQPCTAHASFCANSHVATSTIIYCLIAAYA